MFLAKWFCSIGKRLGGCPSASLRVNSSSNPAPDPSADFMPADIPSDFPFYSLTWPEVVESLDALGLKRMDTDLPDKKYFSTDESTWLKLLPGLTYPGKYFAERERKDCDDYAKKASADSSFYYGLNCLQVWGHTPIGLHAFNLVLVGARHAVPSQWRVFEPDATKQCSGKLLELNNTFGWKPEKWKP